MRERGSQNRQSIRLREYDYAQPGAYFVTVCVRDRECVLGDLIDGKTRLSAWGQAVGECWLAIPQHFPHAGLDAFVVMPNHIHGIIILGTGIVDAPVQQAQHAAPLRAAPPRPTPLPLQQQRTNVEAGSLGAIVRSFKSASTKRINEARGLPGTAFWQRNYYEHVIRNERELLAIREYVANNALQWQLDRENPTNQQTQIGEPYVH